MELRFLQFRIHILKTGQQIDQLMKRPSVKQVLKHLLQKNIWISTTEDYTVCCQLITGNLNIEYIKCRSILAIYSSVLLNSIVFLGYGAFHYKLLALCGWALSSDAIEILSISFILPPATCEMELTNTMKGWLNSSVFLGNSVFPVAVITHFNTESF